MQHTCNRKAREASNSSNSFSALEAPRVFRKTKHKTRRVLRSAAVLLTAIFLFTGLAGCDMFGVGPGTVSEPESIEVKGVWILEGQSGDEKYIITDSSIVRQSDYTGSGYSTEYEAEIVKFSNDGLNAGDTSITTPSGSTQGLGYAVIKYTEVNNAGTGEVGKYNVFRWATNQSDSSKRDFTQGSKDTDTSDDDYINDVFDTADAAETGATNDNGYFGFASAGFVKQ